jgi:hypothetical protein
MGQFAGAPYFQGAIKSDTTLLSQPTSLASSLGRTKGSSRAASKSSTNKDPEGLYGETAAYIMEDIRLDNEMRNIKLDMNKFMVDGGGFNANTYAAAQKEFGPQLSELMFEKRILASTASVLEDRKAAGEKTKAELDLHRGEYVADEFGGIKLYDDEIDGVKIKRPRYVLELINSIDKDSKVANSDLTYSHPDTDELEKFFDTQMKVGGLDTFSNNTNDFITLSRNIANGQSIDLPGNQKLLKSTMRNYSDNIDALSAAGNAITEVLSSNSPMGRAFNYKFSSSEINDRILASQKEPTGTSDADIAKKEAIKAAKKRQSVNVNERKAKYLKDYVTGKKKEERRPDYKSNTGLIDYYDKKSKNSRSVFTQVVMNTIPGISENNVLGIVAAKSSVAKEHYDYLFDSDKGKLKVLGKEALNFLDGTFALTGDDKDNPEFRKLFDATKADIEKAESLGSNHLVKNLRNTFQVAYFKIKDPVKYHAYNTFAKLSADSDDLDSFIQDYNIAANPLYNVAEGFGREFMKSSKEETEYIVSKAGKAYDEAKTKANVVFQGLSEGSRILTRDLTPLFEVFKKRGFDVNDEEALIEDKDGNLMTLDQLLLIGAESTFIPLTPKNKNNVNTYAVSEYFRSPNSSMLIGGKKVSIDETIGKKPVVVSDVKGVSHDVIDSDAASRIAFDPEHASQDDYKRNSYLKSEIIVDEVVYQKIIEKLGGADKILRTAKYYLKNGKLNKDEPIEGVGGIEEALAQLGIRAIEYDAIPELLKKNFTKRKDGFLFFNRDYRHYSISADLLYTTEDKQRDIISQEFSQESTDVPKDIVTDILREKTAPITTTPINNDNDG